MEETCYMMCFDQFRMLCTSQQTKKSSISINDALKGMIYLQILEGHVPQMKLRYSHPVVTMTIKH